MGEETTREWLLELSVTQVTRWDEGDRKQAEKLISEINDLTADRKRLQAEVERLQKELKAVRSEYGAVARHNGKLYNNLSAMTDLAEKYLKERDELIEFLKTLYQPHHYCEDSWYSCPKHPDGCANDDLTDCNCGADHFNNKIDAAITRIQNQDKERGL